MEAHTEEYNKYFKVLELSPKAAISEIRSSYQRLKTLYSGDSIAITAVSDDFSEEQRQNILSQIEEAYTKLSDLFKNSERIVDGKPKNYKSVILDDSLRKYVADIASFTGSELRKIREKLGIELHDIAGFTRIRRQYFEDIELERFSGFSSEVYLKGYILAYAHYLSLDPAKVANDYIARYKAWKDSDNGSNNGKLQSAFRNQEDNNR
ncbi:MAG: helix-turn-helix domain-containing protein [Nitrospirae bacterium]|nr:helix-turn-helix domain-containing protein [Nitrospirota bacterium]